MVAPKTTLLLVFKVYEIAYLEDQWNEKMNCNEERGLELTERENNLK